ncbi:MAG: hypothetical protein RL458_528 [Pseudomonadota bacterium]|jgi:hypothetical protein
MPTSASIFCSIFWTDTLRCPAIAVRLDPEE